MKKLVHLPEDIIVEILLRLPSKSLLKFKCVSKQWRFIVSSKPFIKTRLKNSIRDPDLTHHHIIVKPHLYDETSVAVRSCSVRSIFDEPAAYQHLRSRYDELNIFGSVNYLQSLIRDGGDGRFFMWILGSCNGLILLSGLFVAYKNHRIIIWNPAIRKVNIILPPHIRVLDFPYHQNSRNYSMGYDESTDAYKVVCISNNSTYLKDPWRLNNSWVETHIYSSRTCSWKKIESSHGAILRCCDYDGKFVNGRLHWLALEYNTNRKSIITDIVCLDLVGEVEKYEIMGGPEYLSILDKSKPVLKDLGGYLSLICFITRYEINVWGMMKYGDPRSWTKNFTFVDSELNPRWSINSTRPMPLWLKKNGDMAVYFGADVVIYNGKDKLRMSSIDIPLYSKYFDSIIYVESLVWPFGHEQHSQ